jgi:hypothetical protein
MKLDVSDNDLHILFKKFEDRKMAKVNYMEFIRTIDPESKTNLKNRLHIYPDNQLFYIYKHTHLFRQCHAFKPAAMK